jgi:hypothetical protein
MSSKSRLTSNELEAANRAEVAALLIRSGYRVYRPEADVEGEDILLRTPKRLFISVQLKSCLTVNEKKYGERRGIWMLFPNRYSTPGPDNPRREWYLVPHEILYARIKKDHGHTKEGAKSWTAPRVSQDLHKFLAEYVIGAC